MSRARLSLLVFCLSLCGHGCSTEQPAAKPSLQAHLHQTLTGHAEIVWSVAFSPDGQHLASGSPDRTVRLWRWRDGVLARTLNDPGGVTFIAFSPDGHWLASSGEDKTVKVWRLEIPTPPAP